MSSEDKDILAKISQLAGQINRHKNTQQSSSSDAHQARFQPSAGSRGSTKPHSTLKHFATDRPKDFSQPTTGWRRGPYPPPRGHSRGGRPAQVHRHRTLVLNGNTGTQSDSAESSANDDATSKTNASPSWVTKTDRHLQLINTSIFEKETQTRAKAIEETRQQKLKQRDEREKLKLSKHLQRGAAVAAHSTSPGTFEIVVQGIHFQVAKNGSKLVKVSGENLQRGTTSGFGLRAIGLGSSHLGDQNAAKSTPKTAVVGGVRFHRSKNGNMYRAGIIKAQRRSGVVRKIDELCKTFTTTGSCLKGPRCRYIHDPTKVAVCKEFLQKGSCPSGDSCDLSHDLTPERTPTCLHFAKGNCSNPNCRYTHVHVSPNALNCRPFGIYGYCEKGAHCAERHAHECPDFSNTGTCTTKGCKLIHRHKASVIRRNAAAGDAGVEEENSDLSSDEGEEEIDSDDVDSDDLEFLGDDDGQVDTDVPMQQDFVQLS
ncbi:hypothetical protein BP6252_02016 [Coleophoma cylindrospora]|uniref:C3H1-type domain-containing protein n=1 Tax=Coleophoma cylindrospora TaxID=1849047 RepID=A0A3D8SDK3_9HELO|nr:hypothetical protein BP6252_02016 [Coleophoma cylindrospora]